MENYQKVAVHGLIKDGDKYLVLHRSPENDFMSDYWDTPGGSVEHGENPIEALKREFLEESGLKVKVGKPLFVYSYLSNPQRHQFQILFECELLEGEVKLNPTEHDKFLWVTLDEMGSLKKIAFLDSYYQSIATNK